MYLFNLRNTCLALSLPTVLALPAGCEEDQGVAEDGLDESVISDRDIGDVVLSAGRGQSEHLWLERVAEDDEASAEGEMPTGAEPNPYLIASIDRDGGYVEFLDRAEAVERRDGGVAIMATGRLAEPVAKLQQEHDATALEIYLALAPNQLEAPARLYENHEETADADAHVPHEPRSYFAPEATAALTTSIVNNECPSSQDLSWWASSFEAWSVNYGNESICTSVTYNVDVLTWSSSKRAIGACYHDNACGGDGATISFWGWSGWSWNYISSYFFSGGTPNYGQAVYFGESGPAVGQNKGQLRNVVQNCETVYVGVRSQISGGADQCPY